MRHKGFPKKCAAPVLLWTRRPRYFRHLTDPGLWLQKQIPSTWKPWGHSMHIFRIINIPFERHQFRQASQEEPGTADQFVLQLYISTGRQLPIRRREGGTNPRPTNRQMSVEQSSQKITGSKWKAHTSKGVRDCKIYGSDWKSSEIDRKWFQERTCTRVGQQTTGFWQKEKRKLLPMWVRRSLRTRPRMQSQISYQQKCKRTGHLTKFCRTKIEDKTKRGNVHHVTEDGDFAGSHRSWKGTVGWGAHWFRVHL